MTSTLVCIAMQRSVYAYNSVRTTSENPASRYRYRYLCPRERFTPFVALIHQYPADLADFHSQGDFAVVEPDLQVVRLRNGMCGQERGKDERELRGREQVV